jgi:flagellar biosynthesis protein FlhB
MAGEQSDERTEEATQTRRDEFRKRGQVAMSRELGTALVLIASSVMLGSLAQLYYTQITDLFGKVYGTEILVAARQGDVMLALITSGEKLVILLGPWFLMTVFFALFSTWVQVGFLQVEDALSAKFERLNPIDGFFRLFSLKNSVESLKAILKISLGLGLFYLVLKGEIARLPYLTQMNVQELFVFMGRISAKLLNLVGFSMLALALADYFYQRWNLEKEMMMSKQEIKEEMKNRELDPLIKSRIKKAQRELSKKRMMADIPKADVIITNPTHIAIALKYDKNLPAPQLIAKGADLVAEKMKEIARELNIPIVENKPLARTIFKTMKVGQTIPRELFIAVAEVLSYIYKLKKKLQRGSSVSRPLEGPSL